jgi:cell division protein FtsQ
MARKSSSTIQEELYSTPDDSARDDLDDARLLDLDAEKESPFLRAQKRVPARRSPIPRKTATRLLWALLAIVVVAAGAFATRALYLDGEHYWRFSLNSSDDIEMSGLSNVTRSQVMEVMGGDIGRNIFFISLDDRQKKLEQIPWVESAGVMRFAPNRIRIQIQERTPVAFVRVGSKVLLTDAGGTLMDLSSKKKYSFPVIVGVNAAEPLSTRSARMKIYNELVRELDSDGGNYSKNLSEVDLSDPEDVKVLANDPEGEVLVHLGSSDYLDRFKIYVAHLREWRQQFQKLESVDLRYDRQIIVNPDLRGAEPQPPLSAAAAHAAMSTGVKPAALVTREPVKSAPVVLPKPAAVKSTAVKLAASKPATNNAATNKPLTKTLASKPAPKSRWHKKWTPAKHAAVKTQPAPAPSASAPSTAKSPATLQKPSPAVAKGQGTE